LVGRLGLVGVAAVLAAGFPIADAFASSGLPYTDQYARGSIGLCDRAGNNITHGSVYDKPFAWRAVSSVSAPAALDGPGRKATLYAYQPRKGFDPANWSGQQLGAASAYSSTTVPVAQQTARDPALSDYLNNFPPQWDKLVELRIYFGALNTPVSASAYPAADIQITGTTWTLLNGAKVDCNAGGTVISAEAGIPSSNTTGLQPAQSLSAVAAKAVGAPLSPQSGSPSAGAVALADSQSADKASKHSDATLIAVVAVVVVALGAVAGGWFWRRSNGRVGAHSRAA
jgi:hypothetical protein